MVGVIANLEGPFTVVQLVDAVPLIPMPMTSCMYRMYPTRGPS